MLKEGEGGSSHAVAFCSRIQIFMKRLRLNLPLNPYDRSPVCFGRDKGYVDYLTCQEAAT
jgi:hypothetical protein